MTLATTAGGRATRRDRFGGGWELPCRIGGMRRQDVIQDQRTAKWTANARRLADTHGHARALLAPVEAIEAQAGALLLLHGMQEARGSSPLSSTFSQVKCLLRSSEMTFERLQPSKL
jgi:hypothetical protein